MPASRAVRRARRAADRDTTQELRQRFERQILRADRHDQLVGGHRHAAAPAANSPAGASSTMMSNCGASGLTTSASRRSGCRTLRRLPSIRASAGEPVISDRFRDAGDRPDRVGRPHVDAGAPRRSTGCARSGGRRARSRRSGPPRGRRAAPICPIAPETAATLTAVVVLPATAFRVEGRNDHDVRAHVRAIRDVFQSRL